MNQEPMIPYNNISPKVPNEMNEEKKTISEEIQGTITEIIDQIKKLIREGNARRVIVKNSKGRILFQSQLTIGAAGATFFVLYAPILTAIATLLMIASDVVVIVERNENEDDNDDLKDEYEVDANIIEIEVDDEDGDKDDDTSSKKKSDKKNPKSKKGSKKKGSDK